MCLARNKDSPGQPWKICLQTMVYRDWTNLYTKAIKSRCTPSLPPVSRNLRQLPSVGMAGLETSFPASSLPFLGAALQPLLARWQNLHLALGFFAGCLRQKIATGHVVLEQLWSSVVSCRWQNDLRLRTPQVAGRWASSFPSSLPALVMTVMTCWNNHCTAAARHARQAHWAPHLILRLKKDLCIYTPTVYGTWNFQFLLAASSLLQ